MAFGYGYFSSIEKQPEAAPLPKCSLFFFYYTPIFIVNDYTMVDLLTEEIERMREIASYGGNKKETYWASTEKPLVLSALSKISAPDEWKKMVIEAEKIGISAWNLVNLRHIKPEKVWGMYGHKWVELMDKIGNPKYSTPNNPNYEYWKQYTKLRGHIPDSTFDDQLA